VNIFLPLGRTPQHQRIVRHTSIKDHGSALKLRRPPHVVRWNDLDRFFDV
jgi:hypothetical protein